MVVIHAFQKFLPGTRLKQEIEMAAELVGLFAAHERGAFDLAEGIAPLAYRDFQQAALPRFG